MTAIKAELIDRLRSQYFTTGATFAGDYDGTNGTITVTFPDSTEYSIPFVYSGNKMDQFMRIISQAAGEAIIQHMASLVDRTDFTTQVTIDGNINSEIIEELRSQFSIQIIDLAGSYDGTNGVVHVAFYNGTNYAVNFSYVGDVVNSFIEIVRRAIAYAISLNNVNINPSLYSQVTNDFPAPVTDFTVTLPVQVLWNVFDPGEVLFER